MELAIHAKQMDIGDTLRSHVTDKIEELPEKYFNHATFATVTFSREGHGHPKTKVHIQMQFGRNIMVMSDAVETDPYVAFDSAVEKVSKQLRRYKRKLRDHHERTEQTPEGEILKARNYILSTEGEPKDAKEEAPDDGMPKGDDPVVVAEMTTDVQTMSVSDAVMRLDLSGESVLMFKNANHGGLNVIYRRPDGNIGWIDPENMNAA